MGTNTREHASVSPHLRAEEEEEHDQAHNKGPRDWGRRPLAHGLVEKHSSLTAALLWSMLCLQGRSRLQEGPIGS